MSASNLINPATNKIYDEYIPQGGGISLSKGQLITADGTGAEVAFPTVAPADGSILSYDSGEPFGLKYIAVPGAIPLDYQQLHSANPSNNPAIVPAPTANNYVLTSDNTLGAGSAGLAWKAIGGSGVIQTNAPLIDEEVANVSTISINFTQGVKGELIAGNGTEKTGMLVPPAGPDNYVLTSDASTASGLSWKALGGSGVITALAPLQDLEPVAGTNELSIAFTAVKGEIPAGNGTAKTGALVPAPTVNNYVLTSASGEATGLKWAPLAGPSGSITAVAPLQDLEPTSGTNEISIAFTAAKGEIPAGNGTAKTGALVPAPSQDGYVLTAENAQPTGLAWKRTGPIINRSSNFSTSNPILPPSSVNDTMYLVADRPITESWTNNGAWNSTVPIAPFKSSTGVSWSFLTGQINTGFPFPDDTAPVVSVVAGTTVVAWLGSIGGGAGPFPQSVITGIKEIGGYVWVYGGFDTIGTFVNPPTPDPVLGGAGCIARFDVNTNAPVIIVDTANLTGVDKLNDFATVYDMIGDEDLNNDIFIVGDFDLYSGGGATLFSLKNITSFDLVSNAFSTPAGITGRNLGTDGPIYSIIIAGDPPNYFPGGFYIGGNFQNVGYTPTQAMPFYAGYDVDGGGTANYFPPSAAPAGVVNYLTRSQVDPTLNIIHGAVASGAAAGAAYVLRAAPYTYTAITLPSLPAGAVGGAGIQTITSGTLAIAPPSPPTALFDIITAFNGSTTVSYRSQTVGTWVFNPSPTGVVTTGPAPYGGVRYTAGILYFYQGTAEWKLVQTTSASPITIAFTIAGGQMFANNAAYTTATLNERTSQSFIADAQGANWIAVGGNVGGLVFS